MTCKNCGSVLAEDVKFCTVCGTEVAHTSPVPEYTPPIYSAPVEPSPIVTAAKPQSNKIPEKYEPLGPWAYWAYGLLFSLPIVGFIFLIIFSCKRSNINRRNFAISYWCKLLVAALALLTIILIEIISGGRFLFDELGEALFGIY